MCNHNWTYSRLDHLETYLEREQQKMKLNDQKMTLAIMDENYGQQLI